MENILKHSVVFILFSLYYYTSNAQFIEQNGINLHYPASLEPSDISNISTYTNGTYGFVCGGRTRMETDDCSIVQDQLYRYDPLSDRWDTVTTLPDYRANTLAFMINNVHYYGLGSNSDGAYNDLWKFDTTTFNWTQVATFPDSARSGYSSFVVNNKLYLTCGRDSNSNYVNTCWEYDPIGDQWFPKSAFPGQQRISGVSFTIDSFAYMGLGMDSVGPLTDLWKYDPVNDQWIPAANYPGTQSYNNIYFAIDTLGFVRGETEFWSYSPSTNSWMQKNNFPDTIYSATYFSAQQKGYIKFNNKFFEYDVASDIWINKYEYDSVVVPTSQNQSFITIGNSVYLNGFIYDTNLEEWKRDTSGADWLFMANSKAYAKYNNLFQEFDTATGNWSVKTSPTASVDFTHSIFVINDEAYFIQGGLFTNNYVSVLWKYNGVSDTWTQLDSIPFIHMSTAYGVGFSINNKGYYGLGYDDSLGWSTNIFLEYDPVSGAWTKKADFMGGNRYSAIGLTTNGKGYVGLGVEEPTMNPSDGNIYEYDPTNDSWHPIGNVSPRSPGINFSFGNTIYFGGGYRRVSQMCGGINLSDFYKMDSTYIASHHAISGHVFIDLNTNGQLDSMDVPFNNVSVLFSPLSSMVLTTGGTFSKILADTTYTVTCQIPVGYHLTTAPSFYTITLSGNSVLNIDFGLYPDSPVVADIETFLLGGWSRCNDTSVYTIAARNTGYQPSQGIVEFVSDTLLTFVSSVPSPDSVNGNIYYWHYSGLNPFTYNNLVSMNFVLPGAGVSLHSSAQVFAMDSLAAIIDSSTCSLSQIVRCSFDPNEKSVNPSETDLSEPDNWITYTIHFQNTGNDTAYKVMIIDTIDQNLDLSTIQIIESSHLNTIEINPGRAVVFTFENILLPDSGMDQLASNGHITYRIKPLQGTSVGTQISNKADIYFDANLAVGTNTTINTIGIIILSTNPLKEDDWNVNIFPNPAQDKSTVVISADKKDGNFCVKLFDMNGTVLKEYKNLTQGLHYLEMGELKAGVYYVKVNRSIDGEIRTFKILMMK